MFFACDEAENARPETVGARLERPYASLPALDGLRARRRGGDRAARGSPFARGGGFLLISACAAILVAHVVTGPVTVRGPLAHPLVTYVGAISYSPYLWHFPVFHVLTADVLNLPRPLTIAIRVGLTFVPAMASYHWIENRFRQPSAPRPRPVPVPA